jgi:acyl-CoA thioesterase
MPMAASAAITSSAIHSPERRVDPPKHLHPFDRATFVTADAEGVWQAHTSDDYWNMNGPFGGVTAATLLNVAVQSVAADLEPVSLTVNFCAPMAAGPLTIRCHETRSGKWVTHLQLNMASADGRTVATASVVMARRTETMSHLCAAPPAAAGPDELAPMPDDARFRWLQQYEFRFARGALRLEAGAQTPEGNAASTLWVRHREPRPLDWLSLAALCDIFFLRIFHLRNALVLAGTVSMTAHFHADQSALRCQLDRPVLGCADALVFSRNFFDQRAQLWSDDGHLLATSTQVAWFAE